MCLSVVGVFAPTLFSKAYGNLVCEDCSNTTTGTNSSYGTFTCRNCHYDLVKNVHTLLLYVLLITLLPCWVQFLTNKCELAKLLLYYR